ncbi:hypothetical protein, partial [Escherichia coli]
SSGAGRTSDGNGSHASTLKSPSYTKSVSWQHYPIANVYTQPLNTACDPKKQVVKNVFVGVGSNSDVFTPLIQFNFTNE